MRAENGNGKKATSALITAQRQEFDEVERVMEMTDDEGRGITFSIRRLGVHQEEATTTFTGRLSKKAQ